MSDNRTIYAFDLGAASMLVYTADEVTAFREAKEHRRSILAQTGAPIPEETTVYRVPLRPIPTEAIIRVMNEEGEVFEELVVAREPIGTVGD